MCACVFVCVCVCVCVCMSVCFCVSFNSLKLFIFFDLLAATMQAPIATTGKL